MNITEVLERKELMPLNAQGSEYVPPNKIPVTMGPKLRSGVQTISGFLPAGAIIPANYEIPTFDPRTKRGYQRPSQDTRVNELAVDLKKKRVDLPTGVLLNLRSREARHAVVDNELDLAMLRNSASKLTFYVVDGQHRILALARLIADQGLAEWGDFQIPFICMIGGTEPQEMEQFYVVNSRAKSVRTDLAFALLRQLSDNDHKVLERLEEKGKAWQVKAERIVEALAETSSVWRGLIRLAAAEKGTTTMPSASMVNSLKPLLGSAYFPRLAFEQQLHVIEAFWSGVRDVMRPAFDEPQEFVLQKGMGVTVLHTLLVEILEIVRSNGDSVIEPESYSKVMSNPLLDLQGEAQDGFGTPVGGLDFWRVAPAGAAGSYSSSAGRRLLIAKLRQLLPNVEAV